ncbi:lactosylceramide 4-alpha-galactosyltransferase-like [Spodoptera litura]|uniref:Lactosylceramide 4-alpha-galactosyltransferase-like n=1 Tax=Spodoptera litura TaxID=69820 RepID=A0A9J7J0E4_SPOLT|nr:lactosylceramide 4-alpha-galactosyltransferase-like [Spodoptera litura]
MIKSLKTRRNLIHLCCTLCLFIFLKELYSLQELDISNDYYIDEDIFTHIRDVKFSPKANSIYFHVTSLQGYMKPSAACAVEAAARAHPRKEVYVLFTSPITDSDIVTRRYMSITLKKIQRFRNIKLLRVHLPEYSNGTVVESLLLNNLKNSIFPEQHTADIVKILTLNKYGGVAIDTNMIVLKTLSSLPPNWILKENEIYVAPGIMGFAKNGIGLNVTSAILKEIADTYKPNNLDITNRIVIEKVVQRICPIRIRWDGCKDIFIYPSDEFYPIDNVFGMSFPKAPLSQSAFSFHLDTLTSAVHMVSQDILNTFCPSIYLEFQDNLLVLD